MEEIKNTSNELKPSQMLNPVGSGTYPWGVRPSKWVNVMYYPSVKRIAIEAEMHDLDFNLIQYFNKIEDLLNKALDAGFSMKFVKDEAINELEPYTEVIIFKPEELWGETKSKEEEKKPMFTRSEILKQVEQTVCHDRENQYGAPEDTFSKICKMWNAYLEGRPSKELTPEDVSVMMALLKIARISKNKFKLDSYIDLAGYAICGGAIASMEADD